MKIRVQDDFHLVGYAIDAPMDELSTKIPAANKRLRAELDEVEGRTDERLLNVTLGVEGGIYRQFVGVEVEPDAEAPAEMQALELPAARWVHFAHHGPVTEIGNSIGTMRQWAADNEQPTEHVFITCHPLDDDGPVDILVRLAEESGSVELPSD